MSPLLRRSGRRFLRTLLERLTMDLPLLVLAALPFERQRGTLLVRGAGLRLGVVDGRPARAGGMHGNGEHEARGEHRDGDRPPRDQSVEHDFFLLWSTTRQRSGVCE